MRSSYTSARLLRIGLTASIVTIGFDLFLHAGILAPLHREPSGFLLPPADAFARIPLGYAALALLVALILWLMVRLAVQGWQRGLLLRLKLGSLVWGAETIGIYSISTVDGTLLVGWSVGQTIELGVVGAVVGAGLGGVRAAKLYASALAMFLGLAALGILLQNLL